MKQFLLALAGVSLMMLSACGWKTEKWYSDTSAYAEAYLELIDAMYQSGDADWFALVNIDNDDIPELVASSSEGSWEKDQEFLYTCRQDAPVLLLTCIGPGMEGHTIGFYEGENVIFQTGAANGDRESFYEIVDGKKQLMLSFQSYWLDEGYYFIDEQPVSEADYEKTVDSFFTSHGPRTYLDTSEMTVCPYSKEKECYLEETAIPYMTYDEIVKELKNELPDHGRQYETADFP